MEFGFCFGSNLGDRVQHMHAAGLAVLATADAKLLIKSSLYETDPVDVQDQYLDMKFVNAVMIIESDESAPFWLKELNRIETELGRVRGDDKNAPRTIDIDILYAGDECIDSGGLIVPHPRWAERRFVLEPLSEVRGDMVLPEHTYSVAETLKRLASDEQLIKLEAAW